MDNQQFPQLLPASAQEYDGAVAGRKVQGKATQGQRSAISSEPEHLLVLKLHHLPATVEGCANLNFQMKSALYPHLSANLLSRRTLAGALALALIGGSLTAAASPKTDVVSLDFARAELQAGRAIVIDIREPDEHATGVAAGARLLPMRQIAARLAEIPTDPLLPVLLICRTQNRSGATLKTLRANGYGHVCYV